MKKKLEKQAALAARRAGTKKQLREKYRAARGNWTGCRPCVFETKKRREDNSWKREW